MILLIVMFLFTGDDKDFGKMLIRMFPHSSGIRHRIPPHVFRHGKSSLLPFTEHAQFGASGILKQFKGIV